MPEEFEIKKDGNARENLGVSSYVEEGLGKNQKIALIALGVISFFMMILISFDLYLKVNGPFRRTASTDKTQENNPLSYQAEDTEASLRAKDTDSDGLSDWEELNTYYTSPYIEDTDSDGFSDKKEIDSDNDPNCPTGQDCGSTFTGQENTATSTNVKSNTKTSNDITGQGSDLSSLLEQQSANSSNASGNGTGDDAMVNLLSGKLDAAALREMLLESGMDINMLNKISDQDLMQRYQEMVQDNNSN